MRTLWNAFSFLAVAHLLALVIFIGWLWQSDRLDGGRIGDLRAMFAMTLPQARAAAEADEQVAQGQRQAQLAEARRRDPPLPSAARIQAVTEARQRSDQSARRLDDVKTQLLQQLTQSRQEVEAERAGLAAEQSRLRTGAQAEGQRKADAQFAKAVKLLESLPPKQAKMKIVELVDSGKMAEAVAYLDAMSPRAASKILAQFKTDQENKLATELLEHLRTFGVRPGRTDAAKDSPDADSVVSAR